jgi:hypothetical protein
MTSLERLLKLGEPECTTFKEGTLEGALGGSDMLERQSTRAPFELQLDWRNSSVWDP